MRILLDCDGVLANFTSAYLDVVKQLTGIQYSENDIKEYKILKALNLLDLKSQVQEIVHSEGFCLNIPLYDDIKDIFTKLCSIGDVFVVTAPMMTSKFWMYERYLWLKEHFDLPKQQLIFASDKKLIKGDLFIDDTLDISIAWKTENPNGISIVWDRPWNRLQYDPTVVRTNVWSRVFEILRFSLHVPLKM